LRNLIFHLICINDKAKLIASKLEPRVADDYRALKEAVLRESKTTPAYLLNKFQTLNKDPGKTYILYGSKLMTVLQYYLDRRSIDKDFKRLTELLICDRIKAGLYDTCLKHILMLENGETTGWLQLTDLTSSIDRYYANCVHGHKKAAVVPPVSGMVRRDGQLSTSRNWSSGSFGAKAHGNNVSFSNKSQQGSVRRCFESNSSDHIQASCPRMGSNNNASQSSQHNNQASTQQQKPTHTQASKPIRRTECEHVNIEQFDTRDTIDTVNTAHSVKMANHALTNNLCDLQYIDVVLSDESRNRSRLSRKTSLTVWIV